MKGDVTASDLEDTARPATLSIALSSPDTPNVARRTTADHFERSQALAFTGDCQNPKAGTCAARFRVDVTRDDDGANGGTVRFDWSFDATASGTLSSSIQDADLGPFDPPWTIEISQ